MKKIIFILLLSFLLSEEFIYSVGFRFINVGQASISSALTNDNNIIINTFVSSNRFLDKLYKVRDEINLTVNAEDYSLKKIEKNVVEGKWEQQYSAVIDSNLNVISNNKILENNRKLFDPISIIYSLRNKDLKLGDTYEYHVLGVNEIKTLTTEVIGLEKIKVPEGRYDCIKVIPYSTDGNNIFKENGYMTAWFSNDDKKIPVKIELKTNIGDMILKLKKIVP